MGINASDTDDVKIFCGLDKADQLEIVQSINSSKSDSVTKRVSDKEQRLATYRTINEEIVAHVQKHCYC